MAQFQKRMITIVGIIMIVGVTMIFISSGGDDQTSKEKAPRFLNKDEQIEYYDIDEDGDDDYYSPYEYYDNPYDDYDGLHYDEFVPASENIDKDEVIEEFLGVNIDIEGEELDEYLLELVEEEIVEEYGLDLEEEEILDEYLQELVDENGFDEYVLGMVEDEILDEYMVNMVQEELLEDEIITNEIDENYIGAERLEAIEEVLVARQEYLMNAYNVIEEEKYKHEEEQMKKINPKVGALNPVLNKAIPAAGGKIGIQGSGKPAFKAPAAKMQMARQLTKNIGRKT